MSLNFIQAHLFTDIHIRKDHLQWVTNLQLWEVGLFGTKMMKPPPYMISADPTNVIAASR